MLGGGCATLLTSLSPSQVFAAVIFFMSARAAPTLGAWCRPIHCTSFVAQAPPPSSRKFRMVPDSFSSIAGTHALRKCRSLDQPLNQLPCPFFWTHGRPLVAGGEGGWYVPYDHAGVSCRAVLEEGGISFSIPHHRGGGTNVFGAKTHLTDGDGVRHSSDGGQRLTDGSRWSPGARWHVTDCNYSLGGALLRSRPPYRRPAFFWCFFFTEGQPRGPVPEFYIFLPGRDGTGCRRHRSEEHWRDFPGGRAHWGDWPRSTAPASKRPLWTPHEVSGPRGLFVRFAGSKAGVALGGGQPLTRGTRVWVELL